ncbi:HNH endonuclease [Streptomyces albidoflavus]|uniref:HNH endonuclease n=1 Tax=Streptomyces sp. T7(2022) TaxID=2916034 RepID=UPI001A429B3F|nr:HNH endonuclease [Streptomyces sp. T7(2022)]MBL0780695.1 HNH endonuclease [Streptomyces albidoflavus]MCG5122086.1 HNH endonuclease [Streptomyces sp. T7(2022)]
MTREFYEIEPSPRTSWRLAVLMGANSRTYKFALGSALLEFAVQGRAEVTLDELAVPYAMSLVARQQGAPQAPSGSQVGDADFLTVARQEAADSISSGRPTERLLAAARRSMPTMVMQRFHNLGASEVPHLFYELVGPPRRRTVRLTPHLHGIAGSEQAAGLRNELNARWDIVESSFAAGIGRSLVDHGVAVDWATLRLTDKHRRRPVTGVADALAGFQHGRCLICCMPLTDTDRIAVDHVFPHSLMRRFGAVSGWHGPDLDVIWNLAPAHERCNGTKSARLPTSKELRRLARRNEAILLSPHPLKKTLQLTLKGAGYRGCGGEWPDFLRQVLGACD